jgi:putative ABC transport system permease protein
MRLTLPQERYRTGEEIVGFYQELIGRVEAVPGVHAAAAASQFPPIGPFSSQIEVEGFTSTGDRLPTAHTTVISRDFFAAMGIPLVAGRTFGEPLAPDAPPRIVVNQAFVARYLSGRNPIGARARPAGRGKPGPWFEVIGVVGNTRNAGIASPPQPEAFLSMEQGRDEWNQLFLIVKADEAGPALLASVRKAIASIDPEQPVYAIRTLEDAIADSSAQARVSSMLIGLFAAIALVLAAVGIYGVMSYSVSARRQEMGIRLAVGADRGDVIRLVLRQVLWLSVGGLAIGIGLLLALGRLLGRLLYGVTASDPLTIAAVAALLGAVALVAAWVPALGASRVDPIQALRYE